MTEHTCDRCKRPIGKTWYTVEIYGHNDGPMGTVDSMTQNLSQIMSKMGYQKEYCKQCKKEIENYINCDEVIKEKTYITDGPRK